MIVPRMKLQGQFRTAWARLSLTFPERKATCAGRDSCQPPIVQRGLLGSVSGQISPPRSLDAQWTSTLSHWDVTTSPPFCPPGLLLPPTASALVMMLGNHQSCYQNTRLESVQPNSTPAWSTMKTAAEGSRGWLKRAAPGLQCSKRS